MSLDEKLQKYIQSIIGKFIQQISEKYSIDESELLTLWGKKSSSKLSRRSIQEEVKKKCEYKMKKGPREGELCNRGLKKSTHRFCTEHAKIMFYILEGTNYRVHMVSNLVLNETKKFAVGRLVNNEVIELSADDVELALSYNFQIGTLTEGSKEEAKEEAKEETKEEEEEK